MAKRLRRKYSRKWKFLEPNGAPITVTVSKKIGGNIWRRVTGIFVKIKKYLEL